VRCYKKQFNRFLDENFGSAKENSIGRPSYGTKCAAIWSMLDSMRTDNYIPKLHDVIGEGKRRGFNPATLKTQYAAWRKAYRIPSQRYVH